jgi:hypothetical protein
MSILTFCVSPEAVPVGQIRLPVYRSNHAEAEADRDL